MGPSLRGRSGPLALALVFVLFVLGAASARVVRDRVQSDQRRIIKVYDRFGFSGRVGVDIDVKDDYVHFKEGTSPQEQKQGRGRMGFVLGYDAFEYILEQLAQDPSTCPISATSSSTQETQWVTLLDFSAFGDHGEYNFEEINQHTADGWLSVWFINCVPGSMVSFDITVKMFNTGSDGTRSYISVGEEPLIGVYGFLAFLYAALFIVWVYLVIKNKKDAHRIHVLMAALVLFKFLTMMSYSGRYRVEQKHGDADGWMVAFYIFNALRGTLFFSVVILVAVGWSYMKPFLSERDKKILMVVLPLQIFITIASIVTQEEGPAAPNFTAWDTLLLVAQFVCFCAILFPIVWSMRHLKEASHTDGKAARNYMKMQLFRQFYVWVVVFIYFKLIIFYLLKNILSPTRIWLAETSMEAVTFAFYIFVGLKFRPVRENPFLSLEMADFQPPADSDDEENQRLTEGAGSSEMPEGKGD